MITQHSVAAIMEAAVESPLDVLSRAATMVQENQQNQQHHRQNHNRNGHHNHHNNMDQQQNTDLSVSQDESKQISTQKQLPTAKWKRDRRTRPEYSRKSDPKLQEAFGDDANEDYSADTPDAPLDMSVRQRGQPPSYSQTVNNPCYRSTYRNSVITPTQPASIRDDVPTGISMCDPIIDEHFRRSLGKDYVKIFSNNNLQAKEALPAPPRTPPAASVKMPPSPAAPKLKGGNSVIELMDCSGLSVDDHFAKALGDTWIKLNGNKKEPDAGRPTDKKEAVISA